MYSSDVVKGIGIDLTPLVFLAMFMALKQNHITLMYNEYSPTLHI